ncbi:MAG: ion transporter [Flavobacteriaceae bacterium]
MGKSREPSWRTTLHEVIYEADTPMGKLFDVLLLIFIVLSVFLVALESVPSIDEVYKDWFHWAEWVITILFSIEYLLRIIAVRNPFRYIFSFYGIIDLLSTLPKYIAIIFTGTQSLIALRALRLLRVFRILKLTRYIGESNSLMRALRASKAKILVFMFGVLILCVIFGTVMYLVESDESGFTSIPRSIYWCIVTLTTVGYGDIAPVTNLGQFIAALIMIMGYGIIAVPTGIVTAEFSSSRKTTDSNTQVCPRCLEDNHKDQANFCHQCGSLLNEE